MDNYNTQQMKPVIIGMNYSMGRPSLSIFNTTTVNGILELIAVFRLSKTGWDWEDKPLIIINI